MSKVLIIDDDSGVCRTLEAIIRQSGHEAICALTLAQGFAVLAHAPIDLVLLDVHLPDGNGLESLARVAQVASRPEIIILTAQSDPAGAELAIHTGAWDYIEKPSSPKAIALRITRVLEHRGHKQKRKANQVFERTGIIGASQPLTQALDQMAQTMGSDAGVLITGETGTGKELFALAIHRNSARNTNNFVVVDCAALPETLVESVLFGHVKGAFTGADGPREGLIMQADGGTLFLDEVGEMPLDLQKSFLRVLESHCFRPIGGKQELSSNFRIVSSTNQDLDAMVREGSFRNDLLHRLRAFHLILPPLRNRQEDIEALAHHHLNRLTKLYSWPAKQISPDFMDLLKAYQWPGNVRELVNAMEHALGASRHEAVIYDHHLPICLRAQVARSRLSHCLPKTAPAKSIKSSGALPPLQTFREQAVERAEADYLGALMSASDGSMVKACSLSGVSRSRLYELLKKHAICNS